MNNQTEIVVETAPEMTPEQMMAEIAKLKAEKAELQANGKRGEPELTFKVSEKTGCISVYGLGRFPVSLFEGQWDRFFTAIDRLKAFVNANRNHPAVIAARINRTKAKAEKASAKAAAVDAIVEKTAA